MPGRFLLSPYEEKGIAQFRSVSSDPARSCYYLAGLCLATKSRRALRSGAHRKAKVKASEKALLFYISFMSQDKRTRAHQGHLLGLAPEEACKQLKLHQVVLSVETSLSEKKQEKGKD